MKLATREWIREDVGLLEDERYYALSDHLLAAWEILMKATARQPGERFRDKAAMAVQLRRYMRPKPDQSIDGLEKAGWIVEVQDGGGGFRIRGWEKYQLLYRGPSDDPAKKSERNARRPTTDAERTAIAGVSFRAGMAAAGFDPRRIGRNGTPARLDEPGPEPVE